jgi:hypothetical protein
MQGLPFIRNGKTLLSGIDPVSRACKTADAVSVKDRTLYFCPSPLYGYGLDRLLARFETEAPSSVILCIEADPELYEIALQNIDSSLLADKKILLTNICNDEKLCVLVREAWNLKKFRRVDTIRFSGGWQLYPQLYDSLCETLRREIATEQSNILTMIKLGRLFIRNALRNLSLLMRFSSISELSFGEAPVLILGAGPSLDEILDALNCRFADTLAGSEASVSPQKRGRPFKIVCVDTCLGVLKDRGIVPDLAVILESQHWNLRDFIGCRGWNVQSAVDISALPESAQLLTGKGFLFFTPWTSLRIFDRLKKAGFLPAAIPPLGSVGNTAVELARRLTRGKIICAGLDFSFTADQSHARSSPKHRTRLNTQTRFCGILNAASYDTDAFDAVSKSGLSVRSNANMKNYRSLFEQEFSGDLRVFDIAGSGLPLGIKTLSLKEAMTVLSEGGRDFSKERKAKEITKEKEEMIRLELNSFFKNERKLLEELRGILCGEITEDKEKLGGLIDECDYLWAHFPDCAGGCRPNLEESSSLTVSFLKRLRAEIDPALALIVQQISF